MSEDYEQSEQNLPGNGSNPLATQLSEALNAIDVSNSLTLPLKRAIDEILELAAKAVGSDEASVMVRDGNEGGLKFLTAVSDSR